MKKNTKQKGYAILFTVVLVSIISLIAIGLSNATYKQLLLSSGAKDSQIAFYESDMATECALYVDNQTSYLEDRPTFNCGIREDGTSSYILNIVESISGDDTTYTLTPSGIGELNVPCFRISIKKQSFSGSTNTVIEASGYNLCNRSNTRTVERTIEVNY